MKFGKQLELGQYMPWQSSYLAYKQLKRIIVRRAYLLKIDNKSSSPVHSENKGKDKIRKKDKDKTSGNKHEKHHHSDESASDMDSKLSSTTGYGATMELSSSVSEHSPLLSAKGGGRASTPNIEDDCEDFFEVVEAELAKVNKFVIGKLAELRLAVADFTVQSEDLQRSHHSDGDRTQLLRMKDTYIQLVALNKFCSLNSTGKYMIRLSCMCFGGLSLIITVATVTATPTVSPLYNPTATALPSFTIAIFVIIVNMYYSYYHVTSKCNRFH